ncbi:anaerobic ribonucleoside-triphosphate reductase activating protein [Feifania hominis]|uniref:Anaerobic ribonucleoside-triphosphate reductase-activating protein n=1 Tax=Feifania hominis TaxID=2763660 RepID=A0A926DE83_9FIRM|nr:anaerobic ribonucleoside-triphosphate reductase activating protein [Feifania hominis]MBC8536184.1 anaerobic ribonucleoside-triphosphate reductase activating protein [Feifania hominis]
MSDLEQLIRVAGTVNDSIVDGPGMRFTLFTQGCPHHCPGCHNPQTHDPDAGSLMSVGEIWQRIVKNPLLDGITLSGGEPFSQPAPLTALARLARGHGLHVMAYSGYTFEELLARGEETLALLGQLDLLVDGRFVLAERTLSLPFRGSKNQRILDVPRSLTSGAAVEAPL